MMFSDALLDQATRVLDACRGRGWMLATAESCTGGLIAACLTSIAGSSDVVERGFITYSNLAKSEILGIEPELLATHGAVSEPVARAMAVGALARSHAQLAVAVTGIAGPGGGSALKPVGLVHFGLAFGRGQVLHDQKVFEGDRDAVRLATVAHALSMAAEAARS